ncbi:MAG: sigma 54-interacting transcriptional regulator [Candidatus Manganitrophus sp.]|nr:sigma 54-interacting transcriptional regulator [Candidatus Manganitrophus sp.]
MTPFFSPPTARKGCAVFRKPSPDLILLDLIMPRMDGMAALKRIREADEKIPIIMLTATRTIKTAVEAMKAGADDYLTKPFDLDELKWLLAKTLSNRDLEKEVQALRTEVSKRYGYENIVGSSGAIQAIFEKIRHVADTKTTVLLLGESGTGKELVAKALHYNSSRRNQPFMAINCAAIPESLLETELFGHERGAFTDAQSRRIGRFEQADHGTLFLDEVAELSPPAKPKSSAPWKSGNSCGSADRISSKPTSGLSRQRTRIWKKKSARDVFGKISITGSMSSRSFLPPLRKRKEDIPLLIKHFLDKKSAAEGLPPNRSRRKRWKSSLVMNGRGMSAR